MSENENPLKSAMVIAVSKTLENMAFEQVELIEGDIASYMKEKYENTNAILSIPDDPGDHSYTEDGASPAAVPEVENISVAADNADENEDPSVVESTEGKIWATIPILKPLRGEIVLIFPSDYAEQLTKAIFGGLDSEELNGGTVNDAVAEIINIIAGCFAQELFPDDKRYELGLPNTGWEESPMLENKAITLSFDLGGNILIAELGGEDFCNYENSRKIQEKVS